MKIKKRFFLVGFVLVTGFVVADFFGLFLSIHKDGSVPLVFEFTFIDSVNGGKVEEVEVSGKYNGLEVFYRTYDEGAGVVNIIANGGGIGFKQTILFKQPSPRKAIKRINEKDIEFTFQHPMYKVSKRTISRARDGGVLTVKLVPVEKD